MPTQVWAWHRFFASLIVVFVFEMNEINQENGTKEDCFGFIGPVGRKGDAEVVGIGKSLFDQAGPFFCDFAENLLILPDFEGPGV